MFLNCWEEIKRNARENPSRQSKNMQTPHKKTKDSPLLLIIFTVSVGQWKCCVEQSQRLFTDFLPDSNRVVTHPSTDGCVTTYQAPLLPGSKVPGKSQVRTVSSASFWTALTCLLSLCLWVSCQHFVEGPMTQIVEEYSGCIHTDFNHLPVQARWSIPAVLKLSYHWLSPLQAGEQQTLCLLCFPMTFGKSCAAKHRMQFLVIKINNRRGTIRWGQGEVHAHDVCARLNNDQV